MVKSIDHDLGALRYEQGPLVDVADRAAYDRLLRDNLDRETLPDAGDAGPWVSMSMFASLGPCVANVDVAALTMTEGGHARTVAALRGVAVAAEWRGRGLFRALMRTALTWCDARTPTTILYTAEPALYEGYGFRPVPQHAFVGPAPTPLGSRSARRLHAGQPEDRALIARHVAQRAAVSQICALAIDAATFLRNLRDPDLTIFYSDALGAVIVAEPEDDILTLIDVVAETMPSLDRILGAIGATPRTVRTMFPPDRLGWTGRPDREDTGLMVRGASPPGWTQPFMIAPLSEF